MISGVFFIFTLPILKDMKKQSFTSFLIFIILLSAFCRSFADTIICCQSDTLNVWYYYNGIYFNDEADIKNGDILIIGTDITVYIEFGAALINPDIEMKHKLNDVCIVDICDMENGIFEITGDGTYYGQQLPGGPPITDFVVIQGDYLEVADPYIVPQFIQNPSYKIEIRDDFESYMWSNGSNSNILIAEQPGAYLLEALNHCNEVFTNTFLFDEAAFSENLFYAGKIEGEEIEYVDFDPDSISYIDLGGEDYFHFDLTDDGVTDLSIYISYFGGMNATSRKLSALPQNGCRIAVDVTDQTALFLQQDQIINSCISYSDEPEVVLSEYNSSPLGSCSAGSWGSDGYLGYMIPILNDTIYGWMHLMSSVTGTSSELIIDGYAGTPKIPTEVNESKDQVMQVYPNPFNDKMKISTQLRNYSVRLSDLFGNELLKLEGNSENTDVDLKFLPAGIYMLTIDSGSSHYTEKIVKQF